MLSLYFRYFSSNQGAYKQRDRQRQRERHKTIGLLSKNNGPVRAFYSLVHSFAFLYKTKTRDMTKV